MSRVCWVLEGTKPANTRHWTNVDLILTHRLRLWPNNKSTLVQRLMFAKKQAKWMRTYVTPGDTLKSVIDDTPANKAAPKGGVASLTPAHYWDAVHNVLGHILLIGINIFINERENAAPSFPDQFAWWANHVEDQHLILFFRQTANKGSPGSLGGQGRQR